MGKETKIGLGVIGVLLIVFVVVLTLRLTGSSDESVAVADTEESAVEAKDKDAEKVEAAPKPKATSTKPKIITPPKTVKDKSAAVKTPSSLKLTIPTAPTPEPGGKTGGASEWKMVGSGPQQPKPPAPIPPSTTSRYASSGLVLDPPSASTSRQSRTDSSRYTQRQSLPASQSPRYQSPYGKSNYQSVSTGGASVYGHGDNRQYYGKQRNYVPRQGPPGQPTYTDQRGIAPSQIPPSQITPAPVTPSPITPREPAVARGADGKYEVQPNDNYWRISKRLYGSGAYFKALAEHNRREHPRENKLRVGDLIYAPSLDKLVDSYPDLCPSPRRQKTLEKRASVMIPVSTHYGGGKTYTVAEGDTLYDIARYELGDASRWTEIHDLNRNVLQGDFDYLVPGMKLVLPSGKSAGKTQSQQRQYAIPEGPKETLTRRPSRYQTTTGGNLRR